jgi:tetratricopeptide (TPR) repeat protein
MAFLQIAGLSEFEKAVEAYEKANKIEPNEDVYYNMGIAYAKLGKFEKAIEVCKKAIEIKPDKNEALSQYNINKHIGNE